VTPPKRALTGCMINLSISESGDSAQRGFPTGQVNRTTLQVVAALFGQGASVVFGHDWREDGIMEAVYGFARQVQAPIPLSLREAAADAQPLLWNLLPWPDRPYLPEPDLEQLSSTLRVEVAGLPNELQAVDAEARRVGPDNGLYQYVRARGLTFLRHRLNTVSHVRFCLGGRASGYEGRYPGVIEEAFLAIRDKKPLYLAGFLGGATKQVVDAIEGKQMTDDFCGPTSLQSLYEAPVVKESDGTTRDDRVIDRVAVWKTFAGAGRKTIADANGLTIEENDELFHTSVVDRVIELVLIGMSRLKPTLAGHS
jgi:SLOG cluster2